MTVLLSIINVLFLFAVSHRLWRVERSIIRRYFWPAWLLKMMAGLILGLLYTHYYEAGDTFSFFRDGGRLASLARTDSFEYIRFLWSGDESFQVWTELMIKDPRSVFMTKFVSVTNLITGDNYWIASLYFSFVSFLGAWFLVRTIIRIIPSASLPAIIAFLFFPSVVVWSSGVIKESLAIPSLFFLAHFFLRLMYKRRISPLSWIILPIAAWTLWGLKYFYLGILLPVVVTALLVRLAMKKVRSRHMLAELSVWAAVFIVPTILVMHLHYNFNVQHLLEVVIRNNDIYNRHSAGSNVIHYVDLQPTVWSMLQNSPWALFSGLFRPFVWEGSNVLKFFSGLENLFLLITFLLAIKSVSKLPSSRHRTVVLAAIVYIVLLCIFLALSVPNFGTLIRYRIGFLPFFVFLILSNTDHILTVLRFLERLFFRLVRLR